MHFLAECGAARAMRRLMQLGCSLREFDDSGVSPVHIAAAAGHLLCLKLVRRHCAADLEREKERGRKPGGKDWGRVKGEERRLILLTDSGGGCVTCEFH